MLRCFRKFSCYNINMNIPIDWDKIDATVKEFGFDGESKEAKIVSVYDGDTVKVVFPVLRKLHKFNCRIIASDLDFVKEIVKPSIIFNPFSVLSISNSIDFALENNDIKESEIIIKNKIDKFVELILS